MCIRPGNTDDALFLDTLNRTSKVAPHAHFETRAKRDFYSDSSLARDAFRLVHYAGKVTYDVTDFVVKNKDALFAVRDWGETGVRLG
jgi:myosin-1